MSRTREVPRMTRCGVYFMVNVYSGNKRLKISFGSPGDQRTEAQIMEAFGKWLTLYVKNPDHVLSFKTPYDAVDTVFGPGNILTVGELVGKYISYLERETKPRENGEPDPLLERAKRLQRFMAPHASSKLNDFGLPQMKAVQSAMAEYTFTVHKSGPKKYSRKSINTVMGLIRDVWQWGIAFRITTPDMVARVSLLKPLRSKDRPDNKRRSQITEEEFLKVHKAAPSTVVADMLWLMWETGARPSEVMGMRPCDFIREEDGWCYIPGRDAGDFGDHKTAYRQQLRIIPIMGKSREVIERRVGNGDWSSTEPIFKPSDAMEEYQAKRAAKRETPPSCGNSPGTNRVAHPMITPGEEYDRRSFNNAVQRACKRAGVTKFTPYDLRRSVATRVQYQLGRDNASLLLGHIDPKTTDIYLLDKKREIQEFALKLQEASAKPQ